ncbi:MAG: FlxA-like family protein [Lachnospiraceae bacterium]|nr:FlxA-like family protein [Lachnospiraceae bacterium]
MTINGVSGANTQMGQMGMNQATDSYSRNIQSQIANAQKQMQELSSNENLSLEDKMKKRQEIQQQINDLNTQLRQHQMEQRRAAMGGSDKQQTKGSSMDELLGGTKNTGNAKTGKKGSGISQAGMTAMISADSSMKQAKVQGSVATNLNGTARVLKFEIEMDKERGIDTQKQEEDLAELEQNALNATASQMHTLSEANKTLEEAAKEDSKVEKEEDKAEKADRKEGSSDGKVGKTDNEGVQTAGTEGKDMEEIVSTRSAESTTVSTAVTYTSVDIRL